jgi:UDP-2,3-diacylglucosamine pyrophosphatase LpxH
MTLEPPRCFVLVSDFHMAGGRDRDGRPASYEAFVVDQAFAAFLEYIAERADRTGARATLVLLGDFVDFLHTVLTAAARPSRATAVAKLDRIAEGHEQVFLALSAFRRRGGTIAVVAGNHDIELVDATVQRRFLEVIGDRNAGAPDAVFHPWIYYVPGVLYAEHGSQYHDINAFPALLRGPVDNAFGAVGSHLSRYTVDLLETLGVGDERPPELGRAIHALAAMPRRAIRTAPLHARFLTAVIAASLPLGSRSARGRAHYRADALPRYSAEVGLPVEVVDAIDRRAATSPLSPYRRALRALAARRRARAAAPAEYLHAACRSVDAVLARAGLAVPFYVFGHAHRAEQVAIGPGATYLNTGTWSTMLPRDLRPARPSAALTFVEIEVPAGREPRAELLRWDPEAGRPAAVNVGARAGVAA